MSYFIRIKSTKNGDCLVWCQGTYNHAKKNIVQKTKTLGLISELKKTYTDPYNHFKQLADDENKKLKENKTNIKIEEIPDISPIKNIGYFMIKDYYERLNIDKLVYNFQFLNPSSLNRDYASCFKFLVYSRLITPNSIFQNYKMNKNLYFEDFNFSLDDLYNAQKYIGTYYEDFKLALNRYVSNIYKYNWKTAYFDTTNYYFEIDKPFEKKQKGPSKENRKEPIIGLGLLLDANGIPIDYQTFAGNLSEGPIMREVLDNYREHLGAKSKIIRVADKGLNSGDNIADAIRHDDGYIFSQKIKNAQKELISWVLDDNDYKVNYDNNEISFKIKSRTINTEIIVSDFKDNNKKKRVKTLQKQICFYSRNYALKSEYERNKLIEKALKETNSQRRKENYGPSYKYISEERINDDGEIFDGDLRLVLNEEKIEEDKKLDGYYLIVTNVFDKSDEEIISAYRGLWEIEESFRITKTEFEARPVYVSTSESIEGHFLICYIALLILRLIQKDKLKNNLSASQILKTMRNYKAMELDSNHYLMLYKDENIPYLSKAYNVILNQKEKTKKEIEEIFNYRKKAQDGKFKKP